MSSHAIPEWCSNLVPFVHNRGMWVGSSFGQLKGHSHTDFHYCSKVSQQSFEGSGPFVPTTPWRCSTNAVLVNAWDCICNEVGEQGKGLVLSWTSLLWFGVPLHPDIHYGCGQDMVCLYLSRHRGGYVFLPFGLPSGFHVHQFQASQSITPRVCILMSWTVFFPDGGRPLYSGPSFHRDSHRCLHRAAATSQIRSHVSPWWYGGLVNTPFCEDAANWLSLETVAFQLTECFILYRQSLLSATKQGSYQRCDGSTCWSHLEGVPNSNSEGPLLGGKSTSTTTAFIGRFPISWKQVFFKSCSGFGSNCSSWVASVNNALSRWLASVWSTVVGFSCMRAVSKEDGAIVTTSCKGLEGSPLGFHLH